MNSNNYLFDAYYSSKIDKDDKNPKLQLFCLSQWILSSDFSIDKVLADFPTELVQQPEIDFMKYCSSLSQKQFADLRINLLRNIK